MIRLFAERDLPAICSIQSQCFEAAQWRPEDYVRVTAYDSGTVVVAEVPGTYGQIVAGFAAFYQIGEEAELRNMAVDPAYQRQGIGRALLTDGIDRLAEVGVRSVFLEVRSSNQAALKLYESAGFNLSYTRRAYYQYPPDDALVMVLNLPHSASISDK